MVSTVLVTGAEKPVAEVSDALRKAGAEVIVVDDLGGLESALAGIPPGSLDGYVQLPVHIAARGETVVDRVRNFLEDGLLARFSASATLLPALSDDARVVLVGGNILVAAAAPDDQSARLGLLNVLAHAIQADRSTSRIQVRVQRHDDAPEHIADVVLGAEPSRTVTLAELMAREPKMSFDDFRIEVMGLVNGEF